MSDQQRELRPVNDAAAILRVPARWLRQEVEAGRLPGITAERSILVHLPTLVELLTERAKGSHQRKRPGVPGQGQDGEKDHGS